MFVSQIVYIEALTPTVAVFGDGASKDVIKVHWGKKTWGPDPIELVSL